MSSGVAGCTQVSSKSVEGHMEAQVQLMKSHINYLHDALAEVKETNLDLSQLLSNQQDKAMKWREHDTSCGWNGPIEDQGLVIGAEDGDQRTCIFCTKCSVGWSNEVDLVIDGIEVDDSRTNPLKEGGDDENHIAFHGDSPFKGNDLVLHSSFGMSSLLCRPIKEEMMDLDYLCDRELVQVSYDQDDENVINFGVQTKGDDDLMEISAQEYQESLTLCAP
ncbi:OLC1v1000841C1 [Oldenlandia corymbosa var. corymbosa]|uniref:OLC1v1000841C1 n=1 Tax=Oldenlandia corymbosa var. corymbosa TaxID=529605 RepID=A0AAV1D7C8_OLDCO|nr:OLC1v1000841C1 [Oldenlandia corymbosa var. corymbosa]